jgi:hypothetical protein
MESPDMERSEGKAESLADDSINKEDEDLFGDEEKLSLLDEQEDQKSE